MKNEKGFTLVEMMIVLLIISILLLITIPNVTKHNRSIQDKGCEALVHMVESQVQAYQIDQNTTPASIEVLIEQGYLEDQPKCPDGRLVTVTNGQVFVSGS